MNPTPGFVVSAAQWRKTKLTDQNSINLAEFMEFKNYWR